MKPISTRKILRAIIAALLLVLGLGLIPLAMPANAQTDGLQISATAAFDGNFKYGEWLPIYVEIENTGRDIENAEASVQVNSSSGTLLFNAPVPLPSGSRKIVPIYVLPNNFSRELSVQITSEGQILASQKVSVKPQTNISYLIGLVAPERGALALMSGLRFAGQERPKVLIDISLGQIPERAEGLRSLDLLVINDTDTSQLTPEQVDALSGWVQQGGRLVLGGGAGAMQTVTGLPESLLPVKIQRTAEAGAEVLAPLSQFAASDPVQQSGPFVVAHGEIQDGRVLAENGNLPLVVERSVGTGAVDFVTFDLAGLPFNGWPGTQSFWENLIGPSGTYPDNLPFDMSARQFRANNLFYPLSNIPSLDLPSIKGLSILLIIYVIIVGPLNYILLRWRRKLHLAWITIPVITVLFAGASFGIGYAMRGNDLILNKIALVEIKPDGDALVTSYMGLFSPRMQSYEVTVQGETLISPMTGYESNPWGATGTNTGGQMVFVQGQPSQVKGLTVNQWAMQSFMSEGAWKDFGNFSGDLQIEDEKLVGKVRNDSQYTLTDVVLIMQSRFVRLGDMAPSEEKAIDMGLGNLQADRFGAPVSYRLYQESMNTGPIPRSVELKMNIVSSIFENYPMNKLVSSGRMGGGTGPYEGAIIFGWLDQAPPVVEVADNRLTQNTTAIVYTALDYQFANDGYLTLPAGLIPGALTKTPNNGGSCGNNTSIYINNGEAEFEFQVPSSLGNYHITTLKLALWRDTGNPAGLPQVALYDWKNQGWTSIQDPIQGTNLIQDPEAYINESGLVRVQVASQTDTFGCIYLDLGLDAELLTGQGE